MDTQLAKVIESSDKQLKSNSIDMDIDLPLLFDSSASVRSPIALSQYGTAAYIDSQAIISNTPQKGMLASDWLIQGAQGT
jgi:hypothetical protein